MKLTQWTKIIVFSAIFSAFVAPAIFSNTAVAPQDGGGGGGGGGGIIPNLLYVLNEKGRYSTISVIDPVKNLVTSTLPAGNEANDLVFVRSKYLYVTNTGGPEGTVSVVDVPQKKIIKTISLGSAQPFGGIEFVPPNFVYVGASTNGGNNGRIFVINTISDQIAQTFEFGRQGGGSPSIGPFVGPESLYVTELDGKLSKLNTRTNSIIGTINLKTSAHVFVKPNLLYMLKSTPSGATTVAVLNTDTNTIVADFPAGIIGPQNLAFVEPNFLYICGTNHISVIDTRSNSFYDGIRSLPDFPHDFEFVKPNFLYLSYDEDLVKIIDTSTNTIVNDISSGPSPDKIVSSP
jgi:YVTN family beta-propeller protein